jgi:asparaginyl-tRNA synthetase
MLGVYEINNKQIRYIGNKIVKPSSTIASTEFLPHSSQNLLRELSDNKHYRHLHNIDSAMLFATIEYFKSIKADWCNLPLTTKMISSPGEIYAGKKLDYTSDALPVNLDWFDAGNIFLAESSQFYLEIRLIMEQLDKVFSVYNSFRKEPADFSHLSEFQHIEFEGKVSFEENIQIYIGLLKHITTYLIHNNGADLSYYLQDDEIEELSHAFDENQIATMTFTEAMAILAKELDDNKYDEVSLKNFGSYEEIALTRIVGKSCNVVGFPLEEIPFYHDASFTDKDGKQFAKNADFILLGYREVVGSGKRITDSSVIKAKAEFFNLPADDYEPYIDLRSQKNYMETCGFGLGWQRYTQWLLKMPYIWDVCHIPRGQHAPRP